MEGNMHLVYLEYGHRVVCRYKIYICFVANNMFGYLQFPNVIYDMSYPNESYL